MRILKWASQSAEARVKQRRELTGVGVYRGNVAAFIPWLQIVQLRDPRFSATVWPPCLSAMTWIVAFVFREKRRWDAAIFAPTMCPLSYRFAKPDIDFR